MAQLLSPAGNMEKLKTAVLYGADAVYLSGKNYGLRAFAGNFEKVDIPDAVAFAHSHGVKAYVTLNIFGHPEDFKELDTYISFLAQNSVDAVIVSDPGIFSLARRFGEGMDIHISTQASVTNAHACRFWYELGAKRIVLARELTLNEIISIRKDIPEDLELEVFVHGAMCVAYSGRCLLSNYYTGRDANRGECAQPCRWGYELNDPGKPEMKLDISEDNKGTYLLNSRDICMIEHIPELIQAGIDSFKIEGRMRGSFYVATVTKAYRQVIDDYVKDPERYEFEPSILEDLKKTVHREFDTGFYFDRPGSDAKISYDDTYIKEARVAGIVTGYDEENKRVFIQQRNKIFEGDRLEVVSPKGRHFVIKANDIRDADGNSIDSTPHAKMIYSIVMGIKPVKGSFIRVIEE